MPSAAQSPTASQVEDVARDARGKGKSSMTRQFDEKAGEVVMQRRDPVRQVPDAVEEGVVVDQIDHERAFGERVDGVQGRQGEADEKLKEAYGADDGHDAIGVEAHERLGEGPARALLPVFRDVGIHVVEVGDIQQGIDADHDDEQHICPDVAQGIVFMQVAAQRVGEGAHSKDQEVVGDVGEELCGPEELRDGKEGGDEEEIPLLVQAVEKLIEEEPAHENDDVVIADEP